MESVGMSYAITAAECELKLTSKDKGLVNAAAFIGKLGCLLSLILELACFLFRSAVNTISMLNPEHGENRERGRQCQTSTE